MVDTAIVPLDQRVYRLCVTNSNTEFQWEGQVDADGSVMEGP